MLLTLGFLSHPVRYENLTYLLDMPTWDTQTWHTDTQFMKYIISCKQKNVPSVVENVLAYKIVSRHINLQPNCLNQAKQLWKSISLEYVF